MYGDSLVLCLDDATEQESWVLRRPGRPDLGLGINFGEAKAAVEAVSAAVSRRMASLDETLRNLVFYLSEWGASNAHHEAVEVHFVCDALGRTEESIRAAAHELVPLGLAIHAPFVKGAGFRNDLRISETERLVLTLAGKDLAAALRARRERVK